MIQNKKATGEKTLTKIVATEVMITFSTYAAMQCNFLLENLVGEHIYQCYFDCTSSQNALAE